MNRFKYFIDAGFLTYRQSNLYESLDAALLACGRDDRIDIIPSGHPPWKPTPGRGGDGRPSSPITYREWCWLVLRVRRFRDGEEPFLSYLGELGHPFDAFALAELRAKEASARGDTWESYYVCLWAHAENGCRSELARMPADHLTQLRRARDRAEKRKRHPRLAA